MPRFLARPTGLAITLLLLTAIPVLMAGVRVFQIPLDALPEDATKFRAVPVAHFVHALAGFLFGVLGPLQFAGVLKRRFGRLHRVTGRVFVIAGLFLGLSSFRLLWEFPDASTWLLAAARLAAGLALILTLLLGVAAILRRDVPAHRAWMIRAYAIGMGAATIALIMFPIFIITGAPIVGFASDTLFILSWVINIGIGEWVIRRSRPLQFPHLTRPKRALT
jgi:hypothetical protein